jgi:hypothetical protein
VTARIFNTPTGAAVAPAGRRALALLAAALLAAGPTACGGGSRPNAAALLRDTFSSHRPIASGRVEVDLGVARGAANGFSLHLEGPFQAAGDGRLPSFALAAGLLSGSQSASAGAISTGGRLYLEIGRSWYAAPASAARALETGYAQVSGFAARQQGLAGLGLEPAAWLSHPRVAGTTSVAGVKTTHIVAGLNAARFLADVARLSSAGAMLGTAGAPLAPERIAALSGSVRSGRVDLYTGARDHLLRGVAVGARLAAGSAAGSGRRALSPGLLTFALRFTSLNQPQRIGAPAHARPATELAGALERLASRRPSPGA